MVIWILVSVLTNIGGVSDLFLLNPALHNFKKVEGFDGFPSARQIGNAPVYYSYHGSGCADQIWDSDMFIIKEFKAIRIANIHGDGCEDQKGIFVYDFKHNPPLLLDLIEITKIEQYSDFKWGFIDEYWKQNLPKFFQVR